MKLFGSARWCVAGARSPVVAAGDRECLKTPSDAGRVQPSKQHAPWSSPPRSAALSPGRPGVEAGRARGRGPPLCAPKPAEASFPGSPSGGPRLPSPFLKPMPQLHSGRAPTPRPTENTGSLRLSSSGLRGSSPTTRQLQRPPTRSGGPAGCRVWRLNG